MRKAMTLRLALSFGLAAMAVIALGERHALSADTIRVGKSVPIAWTFTPLDIGKETGIFAKHGLDVEISAFGGDARMQQAFYRDVEGILLSEPLGSHEFKAMTLVSFDGGKTSAAQAISTRQSALVYAKRETTWHDLCTWLATQK